MPTKYLVLLLNHSTYRDNNYVTSLAEAETRALNWVVNNYPEIAFPLNSAVIQKIAAIENGEVGPTADKPYYRVTIGSRTYSIDDSINKAIENIDVPVRCYDAINSELNGSVFFYPKEHQIPAVATEGRMIRGRHLDNGMVVHYSTPDQIKLVETLEEVNQIDSQSQRAFEILAPSRLPQLRKKKKIKKPQNGQQVRIEWQATVDDNWVLTNG